MDHPEKYANEVELKSRHGAPSYLERRAAGQLATMSIKLLATALEGS